MLKQYRFGFDHWGVVLFLLVMLTTFIWLAFPALDDVLRTAGKEKTPCYGVRRCVCDMPHGFRRDEFHGII